MNRQGRLGETKRCGAGKSVNSLPYENSGVKEQEIRRKQTPFFSITIVVLGLEHISHAVGTDFAHLHNKPLPPSYKHCAQIAPWTRKRVVIPEWMRPTTLPLPPPPIRYIVELTRDTDSLD